MNIYAYARVSSSDQKLDRQINAFKEIGINEACIFIDIQSGKDFDRPGYQNLLANIEKGDLIYLKSIDRLGRNYEEILEQWNYITKTKQVDIKVIDTPLLDTTYCKDILGTFISDLVLQIFSFQAEQERAFIKQRQAEGIAAAKAKGVKFGRPKKELPDNFESLYQRYLNHEPVARLAREADGISESTLRLRFAERKKMDRNN